MVCNQLHIVHVQGLIRSRQRRGIKRNLSYLVYSFSKPLLRKRREWHIHTQMVRVVGAVSPVNVGHTLRIIWICFVVVEDRIIRELRASFHDRPIQLVFAISSILIGEIAKDSRSYPHMNSGDMMPSE